MASRPVREQEEAVVVVAVVALAGLDWVPAKISARAASAAP